VPRLPVRVEKWADIEEGATYYFKPLEHTREGFLAPSRRPVPWRFRVIKKDWASRSIEVEGPKGRNTVIFSVPYFLRAGRIRRRP
jgi:hypothetical protein